MIKIFLGIATILSLTIETASAEQAQVKALTQVASTHIDNGGSDQIRNRPPLSAPDGAYPKTALGAHPTQPAALNLEPESIGQGTEP
jgi:hypothetical protein